MAKTETIIPVGSTGSWLLDMLVESDLDEDLDELSRTMKEATKRLNFLKRRFGADTKLFEVAKRLNW